MASRSTAVAAVFVLALFAADSAVAQLGDADDASARQFIASFQSAWNARDAKRLAAMYRPDADQVLGTRHRIRNRAEIEREWDVLFRTLPPGLTNTILVESILPVARDVAVVNVTGNFAGRAEDGDELPRSSDRASYVLARRGGAWELTSFRVYDAELSPEAMAGIGAVRGRLLDAWRRADAKGAAALFADDAMQMIPGVPDMIGRAEIERVNAEFAAGITMEQFELTPQELDARPYIAYERGTLLERYRPHNADDVTLRGRYMAVLRREPDGEWQYHRFLVSLLPDK